MATIALTGSAGGIGRATRERLEAHGHRVIGVDVRDAEVVADLSTPAGRAAMLEGVRALSGGALDGLVAGAGISGADSGQAAAVVSVNYFGAIATLAGLRPLLQRGTAPSAVAIGSCSCTTTPGIPADLIASCLAGNEDVARVTATRASAGVVYAATKLALARWVRRHAVDREWVGAGIRLNAIAPGLIATPMTAGILDTILESGNPFPTPQGRAGQPEDVAALLAYLLSPAASFFCGSVIFMDGGSDAAICANRWPSACS